MKKSDAFKSDTSRWQAVVDNDRRADNNFCYGVITTGIFCRPSCTSRLPNRENTVFFHTPADAIAAGYRPCKRCRPESTAPEALIQHKIVHACRLLEQKETPPKLADLAQEVGLSPYHFHRLFRKIVGITPKQYASTHRSGRLKQELATGHSVTDAIYNAGYSSSSTIYTKSQERLAMKPKEYRKGGAGLNIHYGIAQCSLGWLIIGVTDRGICAIELADTPQDLPALIHNRFPKARIEKGGDDLSSLLQDTIRLVNYPKQQNKLPLDIQGTAFQQQVWAILQQIQPGQTLSYTEVAEKLGRPEAVRAVATACAANKLAVAIPCHRVVSKTGKLSGYRWGLERKKKLLQKEQGTSLQPPHVPCQQK